MEAHELEANQTDDEEELADILDNLDLMKRVIQSNRGDKSSRRNYDDSEWPDSLAPSRSLNWSEKALRSAEGQIQLHLDAADGDKTARRNRDRSDRATVEQVLDRRTRLILFRLSQRGAFDSLEGCISTGKEANVYHAVCNSGESLAVKVYKTSILTFKDRDRYVTGEFRYRHGYAKHNPRKMVATWAEKEMRNLQRMHQAGLPVPKAHLLKSHILVMDFIGEQGWPAPLLKNAEFDHVAAEVLYLDCVSMMRKLYRECKLVHADLSEYNMLYHKNNLVVIDVSQSVEHDHPHSLQFLRSDIINVTKFFNSRGSPVLTPQRLFEFITDPTIEKESAAKKILDNERLETLDDNQYLFLNVYIPHKLDNIAHFERDDKLEKAGVELNNPYQKLIAKVVTKNDEDEEEDLSDENEDSETSCSDESEAEDDGRTYQEKHQRYIRYRGESPNTKRERKQAVQEEKREKRANKVPKHVGAMVVPSANMTRSFINPKDRAAEVAKRRQEVEAELQRRREDRIRQIQERSDNAVKRKQMGLQEKLNKHKTEAEHLKEISKRRLEKESQEKHRLQQMLEKKRSPPRTGQTSTKPKSSVAFGSRVPRHLDLTKSSSGRSASSSSPNNTLNSTANSLMTRSVHPVMTPVRTNVSRPPVAKMANRPPPSKPINTRPPLPKTNISPRKAPENRMSRSVHPELCPTPNKRIERTPVKPVKKTVAKVVTTPVPIKTGPRLRAEQKIGQNIEVSKVEQNIEVSKVEQNIEVSKVEQNIEVPKEPQPELVLTTEPISEPVQQQIEELIQQKIEEPTIEPVQQKIEEPIQQQIEEPTIEPIQQHISEPAQQHIEEPISEPVQQHIEEPIIDLDHLAPVEVQPIIVDEPNANENISKSVESTPRATEFGQLLSFDSSSEEKLESVPQPEFIHNRTSSDDHDSTRTRTITPQPVFSDDEHDSGVVPETPSPPIEKETVIEPIPQNTVNQMFLLNSTVSQFSPTESAHHETPLNNSTTKNSLDEIISDRSEDSNGAFEYSQANISSIPADPVQVYQQSTVKKPTNGASPLSNGGVVIGLTEKLEQERNNRRAKLNEILSRTREQSNSASPVKSESDASELAKNLLARRSERLNESTGKQSEDSFQHQAPELPTSNGNDQKLVSLADEFENLGLSTKQEMFLLPGQIPDNNNGISG
ncbi:Serine/threonine-protein kinase RIO1 [Aphelenchoides bicaudatus]|nr:Serine/threonine-protein kinase RIO1 [Aphelenchoides bicaudatus]